MKWLLPLVVACAALCGACGDQTPLSPSPAPAYVPWVGQPLPAGCVVRFLPPTASNRPIVQCPAGTPGF